MKWLEEDLSGVRIHKKLREEGEKVFVRMHALPGEEGQVNFGYLKLLYYAMKARKERPGSLICINVGVEFIRHPKRYQGAYNTPLHNLKSKIIIYLWVM